MLPRDIGESTRISVGAITYERQGVNPLPVFWDWLRADDGHIVGIRCLLIDPLKPELLRWLSTLEYCVVTTSTLDLFIGPRQVAFEDGAQMMDLGFYRSAQGGKALLLPLFPDEEKQFLNSAC